MKQEDKAKAYDKVRKKIAIKFGSNVADEFFAEFEGSKDERVRKALIDFFGNGAKYGLQTNGVYDKDILAWLEKQELKSNPYSGVSFNYNGHIWGMCARDGGVEILMDGNITSRVFPDKNNIIEQKPTDSYCHENCKGFQETGKCFADGECKAKRKADSTNEVEPKFKVGDKIYLKPEYRMPDDDTPIANTVKEIKRIDDKHYRFDGSYIFVEDQDKYELVEQKPAEWSEEDEQHIDSLLKRLDALCRNKFERTRFAISEDRDWLKSIRPQNHWKPSDEQMGCLSDAIEHYNSLGYPASKLKELLDDLKKINGEV